MARNKFTDIFIKRPVLATVVSLLILFVGFRSILDLQVRQFPKLENTVITVTTAYPGAAAQVIEGFITSPLEKKIAGADGIDYLTSQSIDGASIIKVHVRLNFNPSTAFTEVMSKVAEVQGQLPRAAEKPIIQKDTGSDVALMYLSFSSKEMSAEQITDYISRVVQPKLETVPGVAEATILGAKVFAMRIWLNTVRMAALGVTPEDVSNALQQNNFLTSAGKTEGKYVEMAINAKTDLETTQGFKNIVVKRGKDGALVRLKDVAKVVLGSESYDSSVVFNGQKATFVAISATPSANPLNVITDVRKALPGIKNAYPPALQSKIVYDATRYIRASIKEVAVTILEATVIVIIVIFLFLGSLRTVVIPIVTIPLSLIGVATLMLALGYSINLLTLLAMVLAIGMVVDDAIVVVENIYRHIEEGMLPFDAAVKGAREIAMPIISMTITLAAVYAPIGFMGGLTGALFKEFAFTLASTVILSGVISLTLSPMMCSRILTANIGKQKLVHYVDDKFERLKNSYHRRLSNALRFKVVTIFFAFVVLLSCIFLYINAPKELAPTEDQGVLFVMASGPQYANLNYMEKFTREFNDIYSSIPAGEDYFIINGFNTVNSVISALILKTWGDRKQGQQQINAILQKKLNTVAGLQVMAFPLPPLPTSGSNLPIDFVITSTMPYNIIYPIMQKMVLAAKKSGLFIFINGTLKFDKPQIEVNINRSKAAQLGISMQNIGNALSTSLGGNYVNRFNLQGRSYKVIPQVGQQYRFNPDEVKKIYINTAQGALVPLASLINITYKVQPNSLTRFQQLNSATLQGMMRPGNTLEEGLNFLREQAKQLFPQGVSYDYGGQSRQLTQEGSALIFTFLFSIIIIYLVLAAQFESLKDPLVIMTSVPMAISGALLIIHWSTLLGFISKSLAVTVNIYTQIGLITLIGLISKHGILMVEFANKLQKNEGLLPHEAILKAAAIRLRPVLMTTFAMILGVVPLIIATGAGARSRYDIGMVIAFGMGIGTLFTLFVIPTMYMLKGRSILLFLTAVAAVGFLFYQIFYVLM